MSSDYEQRAGRGPDTSGRGDDAAREPGRQTLTESLPPRDASRERKSGDRELDRRVGTHGGQRDGSGAWGAEAADAGGTDRANRDMWMTVASAAEAIGLTNAARHMRHYLWNSGASLQVSVDQMLRDVAPFRVAYDRLVGEARAQANLKVAGIGQPVQLTNFALTGTRRSDVYCSTSQSRDWYFAIGGFTYWYTAEVQVIPVDGGPPQVNMIFVVHIFDRYNWDQGKAVQIAGITVHDEQLGRLHRVGLAHEYDVVGSATPREFAWTYRDVSPAAPSGTAPTAGARDGGRTDPRRE